jgi:outer membrane protein OmpA-like peptidoglycan-associated protein
VKRCTPSLALVLGALAWSSYASAETPVVHAAAGAAHGLGSPQGTELGTGAGGSASVEVPLGRALGVQAGAGALVLPESSAPSDATLAERSTASAIFGAAGVRVHPVGGLWLDANAGVAQTGSLLRPALDAHLGWDFRVGARGNWGDGPFAGYMQIVQPEGTLRSEDARVVLAGIQVSLGGGSRPAAAPPPSKEAPPAPAPAPEPALALDDHDGEPGAMDVCPSGMMEIPDEGCQPTIELVDDRIVLGDIIHFEFDSPKIHAKSRRLVARVAAFILDHPEIIEVDLEGHADARGTDAYNQRLSEQRAESTRAMLVKFGVDGSRLRPIGHGKRQLKVQTPLADRRNRRVEFTVVTKHEVARVASDLSGKKGKQ